MALVTPSGPQPRHLPRMGNYSMATSMLSVGQGGDGDGDRGRMGIGWG